MNMPPNYQQLNQTQAGVTLGRVSEELAGGAGMLLQQLSHWWEVQDGFL